VSRWRLHQGIVSAPGDEGARCRLRQPVNVVRRCLALEQFTRYPVTVLWTRDGAAYARAFPRQPLALDSSQVAEEDTLVPTGDALLLGGLDTASDAEARWRGCAGAWLRITLFRAMTTSGATAGTPATRCSQRRPPLSAMSTAERSA